MATRTAAAARATGTSGTTGTAGATAAGAVVTSDAHAGLVAAIGATLPAAAWQRCRTHYAANHGRHNA